VVHGGERFSAPIRIDAAVLSQLRTLSALAPLHNPANLLGIEAGLAAMPDVPQVAVFDTAFHQTMPPHAFRYPVPEEWYVRHGVRRYGFHGTSHRYVAARAAAHLGRPLAALNLITLHLGNGASAAAILAGRCVDTSMGLTPLEGLMMGTRCGDIDPAIPLHIAATANLSPDQVDAALNHASGLLRKYIGAYAAILERVDAVVFTAGIGENAAAVRRAACSGLGMLGIEIDEDRNRAAAGEVAEIQSGGARLRVLVIRTNEELEIARQTMACLRDPARGVNPAAGSPGNLASGGD
jgi:acetate kinase